MKYELWDSTTGALVDEAATLEELAELKADWCDAGQDISALRILTVDEDGNRAELVE